MLTYPAPSYRFHIAVLALLCLLALPLNRAVAAPPDSFRIVAYLPDYRVLTVDPKVASQVTDLIFFSVTPTPEGGIDTAKLTPEVTKRLGEIKRLNPKLQVLVALGGADRSDGFAPMAKDATRRQRFVGELLKLCQAQGFDGVDFDWEFPKDAAESETLNALLRETKVAFAQQHLRVTLAVAPWDEFPKEILGTVDSLHLMTYFDETQHTAQANARLETEDLIRKGADPGKICMGLPFYGETVGEKDNTPSYGEIQQKYHPLPAADEANGVAFNGIRTVRQKARYALEKHLGGVMIWEIGQDSSEGTLLHAIQAEVAANNASAGVPKEGPPETWKEHWFEHNQLLHRVGTSDEVALYLDDDVPRSTTAWMLPFLTKLWRYTKDTYGEYGAEGRLYAVLHQGRYSGGHPSTYLEDSHDYRNVIDCGPGPWGADRIGILDIPSHEVGHIVEGASRGVRESPAFDIWGDSKWIEFYQYDAYRALGLDADAKRLFDRFINGVDSFPRPGTHWFRDWFYPLWRDYGHAKVMVNYFRLLAQYFPAKPQDDGRGTIFTRRMTWGEYIHFMSGAAGKDLKPVATKAFGWSDAWETEYKKARKDFSALKY